MVVDSSAFVSVVLEEPNSAEFLRHMTEAPRLRISAVTLAETSMVLMSRGGQVKVDIFDALLDRLDVFVIPVDKVQARLAREAHARYGKGRDKAKLNLGDCFVYALAKFYDEPLLFQGNDFPFTDLILVRVLV